MEASFKKTVLLLCGVSIALGIMVALATLGNAFYLDIDGPDVESIDTKLVASAGGGWEFQPPWLFADGAPVIYATKEQALADQRQFLSWLQEESVAQHEKTIKELYQAALAAILFALMFALCIGLIGWAVSFLSAPRSTSKSAPVPNAAGPATTVEIPDHSG